MESILTATFRHLQITFSGVLIAALVGIGTGILITKHRRLAEAVMSATDLIQTVPSLALLAILMMFFGLGDLTVIIALFLYSLLPIIRNTYVGLKGIDNGLVEAGVGMGMTRFQLLWKVKFPIALPVILSGIRVALVTALGIATIGVLIGAGGLGTFVYRGVQMADIHLILTGAVPLSLLAIGTDLFLEVASARMLRSKRRTVK